VKKPLVTTIITTRNRPQQVRTAIGSVLAEDYPAKDIVVVDDCSETDNTGLLDDFPGITLFRTDRPSGVAISRNLGLRESSGEFVTFLDDDDIVYPGKISVLTETALKHDASFVFGRTIKTFGPDKTAKVLIPEEDFSRNGSPAWPLVHDFLLRMPSHNNAVLLKKEDIARVGGYSEDVIYFDDWAGWLKMFAAGVKPVFVHLDVAEFRYHQGGLSDQVNSNGTLRKHLQVLLEKSLHYFSGTWQEQRILYALLSDIKQREFQDYDEYVRFIMENRTRYLSGKSAWYFNSLDTSAYSVHDELQIVSTEIKDKMVDPPELEPSFRVEIDRVGICDQEFYLSLAGAEGVQQVLAKADIAINLPPSFRGIHMSRIVYEIEQLTRHVWMHPLDFITRLAEALDVIQHGSRVYLNMALHVPIMVHLVESGRQVHQNFKILCGHENGLLFSGIVVPHMTACPCVQCYSDYINASGHACVPSRISHSQRAESTVKVWASSKQDLLDFDLLEICQRSLVIVCDMLRREDEFSLVYRAHIKPQFIEDCIRDIAAHIVNHPRYSSVAKVTIHCRSYESIHTRDISADIELIPAPGTQ